jgi:SAM-dependent methyltransferase
VRIRDAVELISGRGGRGDSGAGGDGGSAILSAGPGVWADLGCGDGTFTRALAQLLAAGSVVHAVDLDAAALANIPEQRDGTAIVTHRADFTRMPWPFEERLDGILMANSLHYIREQEAFVRECGARFKDEGRIIVVEYDFERPNRWVPYPVSRRRLTALFARAGYSAPVWLGSRASVYQRGEMYAAMMVRSEARPERQGHGQPT